jgi:hypothetical protein
MTDETKIPETMTVADNSTNPFSLMVGDSAAAMALWTDDKKKDYVSLFKQRANASMYILRHTARELAHRAKEKQFLGIPRYNKLVEDCASFAGEDAIASNRHGYHHNETADLWRKTYDRSQADMDAIVQERVVSPSLNAAMLILDPETHAKMLRRDEIREKGQELTDKFAEVSVDVRLSDMDQTMTIGGFRAYMKDLEGKRKAMLDQLEEIGKEGQDLERHINKALFKGLPGIGEEIESVVKELYQQSKDMGSTSRSVENTVLYGDCEAALAILESFKSDEKKVSTAIGLRFQNGLELLKLKLAGKKSKKKTEELSE